MADAPSAETACAQARLQQALLRRLPEPGKYPTAIKGFFLARHNEPQQLPLLAPLIAREIHCRLLEGPCGGMLRQVNTLGTQSHQVAQTVAWLRQNFCVPLRVQALALRVSMATWTFFAASRRSQS